MKIASREASQDQRDTQQADSPRSTSTQNADSVNHYRIPDRPKESEAGTFTPTPHYRDLTSNSSTNLEQTMAFKDFVFTYAKSRSLDAIIKNLNTLRSLIERHKKGK